MRFLTFILSLMIFLSCSSEDDEFVKDRLPQEEVHVLFSTSSFGDHAYNDMILYGIQKSCSLHKFKLIFHQPKNITEGWNIYKDWYEQPSKENKELFIISTSEYEDSLLVYPPVEKKNKDIILFEATHEFENMATFNMETFGAAYLLGQLVGNVVPSAAVLLANKENENIKVCAEGFKTGFLEINSDFKYTEMYLSKRDGEGFNQPDVAYRMSSLIFRQFQFLFPIAGGSNMGVYRYCRENSKDIYTAGIDGDMNKYTNDMIGSLVKRIDCVLENYIQRWYNGEKMKGFTNFGLESEFVNIAISPKFENIFSPQIENLKEKAIKKENEYLEIL